MHGNKIFGVNVLKNFQRLVRPHVGVAKGFRIIGADGKQRDFRRTKFPDFLESGEIGAVARVIKAATLVLQNKTAVAAMAVAQDARSPVLAGR